MSNEQDPRIEAWLDTYNVADADQVLLDRIVANALSSPQKPTRLASSLWRDNGLAWSQMAAFACLGLLGFWGGAMVPVYSATPVTVSQLCITDQPSFNKLIFGPQTLTEVRL